jgi:hypothetical protein
MYFTILLVFTFVVLDPIIAAVMACAAWRGKGFNVEACWFCFVATVLTSIAIMSFAQRMQAVVGLGFLQAFALETGAVLFGVAGGFAVSILTFQRGSLLRKLRDRR